LLEVVDAGRQGQNSRHALVEASRRTALPAPSRSSRLS